MGGGLRSGEGSPNDLNTCTPIVGLVPQESSQTNKPNKDSIQAVGSEKSSVVKICKPSNWTHPGNTVGSAGACDDEQRGVSDRTSVSSGNGAGIPHKQAIPHIFKPNSTLRWNAVFIQQS